MEQLNVRLQLRHRSIAFDRASTINLLRQLPEVRPRLDAYIEDWNTSEPIGDPVGLYNLWAEVFDPHWLQPLLAAAREDAAALSEAFSLVEDLATDGDAYVKTFVKVGVCEGILFREDHPDWLERAQRYMGPQTLLDCIELQHQIGS